MNDSPRTLLIEIDSRLEAASLVGTCIRAHCLDSGLDEMITYQVQTCTIEAVNNAIIHAYGGEAGHRVEVRWTLHDTSLRIEVGDSGRAMARMPPETEPDPLAESGRGWWIIRQWMDSADYASRDGRNLVTLIKSLC